MPFRKPYKSRFSSIFAPAVEAAGLSPKRADDFFRPAVIMNDIYNNICASAVLLAELSQGSANVFYEVGLAHALGKPVVLVAEDMKWVPFDLRNLRVLIYSPTQRNWRKELRAKITTALVETAAAPGGAQPFFSELSPHGAGSSTIKLYRPPRESSDRDMLSDLETAHRAIFIGVSHQKLAEYFETLLTSSTRPLNLETIDVCYASDDDGQLWEGARFAPNARESRFRVALTLLGPTFRAQLPRMKMIAFLQSKHHRTFGGCALIGARPSGETYYANHYLPRLQTGTEDLLTFRFQDGESATNPLGELHEAYRSAFKTVRDQAHTWDVLRPSLWDLSVDQWRGFACVCNAHRASMQKLAQIARLRARDRVLDVGAATGDTSRLLLEISPRVALTVLDSSPAMLAASQETLGKDASYALCTAGELGSGRTLDLEGKFDAIVSHLALPALAGNESKLFDLCQWCERRLSGRGRVVLSCHNTAVETPASDFEPRTDPLRTMLRRRAAQLGIQKHLRARITRPFRRSQIERSFLRVGLEVADFCEQHYQMTMSDRLLMWESPAVLDRFLDVRRVPKQTITRLLEFLREDVADLRTPDMIVKFWVFRKRGNAS
jgi:SAM-dependent methyltransferase